MFGDASFNSYKCGNIMINMINELKQSNCNKVAVIEIGARN